MKKRLSTTIAYAIMRITILQVLLLGIGLVSQAKESNGQEILEKKITFSVKNEKVKEVLSEISRIAHVKFMYSAEIIKSSRKISVDAHGKELFRILDELLGPLDIKYELAYEYIVLMGNRSSPDSLREEKEVVKTIIGSIVDEKGEPLSGVSVTIKGQAGGTSTNEKGIFTLSVPDRNAVLLVSYTGYISQEIAVKNQTRVTIVLVPGNKNMNEVVVVGYGSQSKRNVSSSISSISAADVKNMAVTGIDKAIQGKAAGVQVTNNTGEPGGGVTIRIRGTTSIGSGNDPLYVIDGIPLENTQTSNVNVGENRVNGMSQINPADIKSIEILKDAAATSIYGARAANGVVLITTKRGMKGKSEFNLDYYAGSSAVTSRYHLLNASDYARLANEGRAQLAAGQPQYSPIFSDAFINKPTLNTNWQDEIFRTGMVHNANASIRGGTDNTKYNISGGYMGQKGVIIGSEFQRYSLRAGLDQTLGRLTIGTNLYTAFTIQRRTKNDGSPIAGDASNGNNIYGSPVLSSALVKSPATAIYNPDGSFTLDPLQLAYANPVRQAIGIDIDNNVTRVIASAYGELKIVKGLTFRSQLAGDLRSENENWFNPPNPSQFPGLSNGEGQASRRTFDQKFWNWENYFTYNFRPARDHNFSFLLGNTLQKTNWESSFALVRGIETAEIPTLNAGTAVSILSSDRQSYGIVSYFSRLNYDYQGKYLLLLNGRYDGSSRFGAGNRYGFFPSGSIGWRVSQESFMKSVKAVSDLKIRASYGFTGNQDIANFASKGIMALGTGTQLGNNYTNSTGATIQSLPSTNLKWESTRQMDLGLDISLLNSRLNLTVDYYVKTTDNLLFNVPLPATRGLGYKLENVGKMENRGLEFGLNAAIIVKKDFTWNLDLNISGNRNKVLSLLNNADVIDGNQYSGYSIARVGHPINFYLYQREKYVDAQTGKVKLIDQDKNGLIESKDMVLAGSPFPDYFGGFTNNLSYKNFDLSIFFQFSYGNKIYNVTRSWLEQMNLPDKNIIGSNTTQKAYDNHWRKPGDITEYPKVNYNGSNNDFNKAHDGWLENGSYLRLKSLTLGYNFPKKLMDRAKLTNVRIYISANNPLVFTKYSGLDPEVSHFTGVNGTANSGLRQGYDYGSFPQAKLYMAGINITL